MAKKFIVIPSHIYISCVSLKLTPPHILLVLLQGNNLRTIQEPLKNKSMNTPLIGQRTPKIHCDPLMDPPLIGHKNTKKYIVIILFKSFFKVITSGLFKNP